MARRIWKDRAVERPRTFNIQNNPDGTVTLIPAPGQIVEPGTPVNAANLNGLEEDLVTHMDNYEAYKIEKEPTIVNFSESPRLDSKVTSIRTVPLGRDVINTSQIFGRIGNTYIHIWDLNKYYLSCNGNTATGILPFSKPNAIDYSILSFYIVSIDIEGQNLKIGVFNNSASQTTSSVRADLVVI